MGIRERILSTLGYEEIIPEAFIPQTENRGMIAPTRDAFVINETTALSLIPVSRAISVLETAIQQIPVEVYRDINRIPNPVWLETPDIENNISQSEFIGQTVVSMAISGNAFWKVTRGQRGIASVQLLPYTKVVVTQDINGVKKYTYNTKEYTANDIVHLKLWNKTDSLLGEGPLQRHKTTLKQAWDLQRYADNWFQTAAVPTGTLTTSEFLSADIAKANKDAFVESQKERSVAVLSSGLKYESISLNPEQAQFLENQKHMTRQIATMFGVPSLYLGLSIEGQGMTYVNGNEDRNKLYEDGLQQYIVRIQQALTDLLPRGQKAKFNLTEFLRPNQLARYQAYAIGITNNFLTLDEIRSLEGLPTINAQAGNANTPQA